MERLAGDPVWVTEAELREGLERLRQQPIDRREGLFGPGSMFWEVNKHAIVYFLGAAQAVQMQLAHPWIATAVYEHSKIMSDPRQRARLTYIYLWSLIYGDLDMVTQKSTALFRVHGRVKGSLSANAGRHVAGSVYGANEVNALLWVHVTAFYTRVKLYDALIRPLRDDEKDRFCREAKQYAYCFGIPEAVHPDSWQEVESYVAAMQRSDALAPTEAGLRISRFLRDSIPRPLRRPLSNLPRGDAARAAHARSSASWRHRGAPSDRATHDTVLPAARAHLADTARVRARVSRSDAPARGEDPSGPSHDDAQHAPARNAEARHRKRPRIAAIRRRFTGREREELRRRSAEA